MIILVFPWHLTRLGIIESTVVFFDLLVAVCTFSASRTGKQVLGRQGTTRSNSIITYTITKATLP
jgi:hypothetical protein